MFTQHQQMSASGGTSGVTLGSSAAASLAVSMPSTPNFSDQVPVGKLPLSEMPRGGSAVITDIRAQGMLGRRLRDMGLLPGVAVSLVSRAPLGDPLVVALDGYALSVRCAEAANVIVEMQQEL